MRIIADIDCTTADFIGAVCKIVGEVDRNKANRWDWFRDEYPPEVTEKISKHMCNEQWWANLPVIKDANKGIAWLRGQGHQLLWVTVPFIHCHGWLDARREWVEKNFNIHKHNEPLITCDMRKYLINADAIIDDIPEIVDRYGRYHPEAICLTFKSELNRNLNRELVTWKDIMEMRCFWHGKRFGKDS